MPRSGDVTPQILAEPVLDEPVGGCLAHSKDLGIPKILWQELWQISWLFLWQELWPAVPRGHVRVAPGDRPVLRAALRTFYGWAHASGRLDHNPAGLLPPIRPARHAPRPAPERAVADALLSADDRQRLMVLLAVREGLRRGEIARVHSDDLIEEAGGWSLRVHGKGDKIRVVPLSDDVALELMVLPSGWAFPGQVDGHLSPEYVGKLVSRLLPDGWTTHTLRHRFATNAYAGQRDLFAVQTLLGHSSPETTRRYVHVPDESLRAAVMAARA